MCVCVGGVLGRGPGGRTAEARTSPSAPIVGSSSVRSADMSARAASRNASASAAVSSSNRGTISRTSRTVGAGKTGRSSRSCARGNARIKRIARSVARRSPRGALAPTCAETSRPRTPYAQRVWSSRRAAAGSSSGRRQRSAAVAPHCVAGCASNAGASASALAMGAESRDSMISRQIESTVTWRRAQATSAALPCLAHGLPKSDLLPGLPVAQRYALPRLAMGFGYCMTR